MKRIRDLIGIGLGLTSLGGCERVVDVTVPSSAEQLVVEGRIESVQGRTAPRQEIILSTSAPYFQHERPKPVRDAQVSISDDNGRVTVLRESPASPGRYVADDLVASVGAQYTLRIRWRGDEYAATDSLRPVPPIDSLYLRPRTSGGIGPSDGPTAGLRATIDTRDPGGVANFYMWDMFIDGVRVDAISDTSTRAPSIDSDQFNDGLLLRAVQPHPATPLRSQQDVLVRQHSLSEQIYRYYRALTEQVNRDGSPFSAPPNPVRGNVANLTRPSVRALGYFMATEVSERRVQVP